MLYRIAALVDGAYVWVSDYVRDEEVIPHMYRVLVAAYGQVVLKTFEGYDAESIVTAFLIASAYEKEKFLLQQHQDHSAGKTVLGAGGDHNVPYVYSGPAWGKQESIWCQLLGEVQAGKWAEDLRDRPAGKKKK